MVVLKLFRYFTSNKEIMQYSSLQRKLCKCGECTMMPTISYEGYYHQHAPKEVLDRLEVKQKRKNAVKKDLTKLRVVEVESDDNRSLAKNYGALDRWFKERRKEMTGICQHCGGKSCKDNDQYYKFSIAHLLPKNFFKSIATHPDNWIELCHFGKSCHANLDNHMIDLIELNCFDTVIQKFTKVYPHIAKDELRRVPPILIEYLKTEL